jgi:hypothetical protein
MGLGGCEGSFWPAGLGLPSGSNSSVFVPHPASVSARTRLNADDARGTQERTARETLCKKDDLCCLCVSFAPSEFKAFI